MNWLSDQILFEHTLITLELARSVARTGMQIVELGTYTGKSAIYSLLPVAKAHSGHVTLVDWFKGNDGCLDALNKTYKNNNVIATLRQNLNESKYTCYTIVISSTEAASKMFKDSEIDFVFVDAGHTYSQVKSDILHYWPKLKPGGIMAGHDFECPLKELSPKHLDHAEEDFWGMRHVGVIKAVCEMFDGITLPKYKQEATIWSAIK